MCLLAAAFVFASLSLSSELGEEVSLEGFFGALTQRIFYITERYQMSKGSVDEICEGRGWNLFTDFRQTDQVHFIKEVLSQHYHWPASHHIWAPYILVNSTWFPANACHVHYSAFDVVENHGISYEPKCAIINMTQNTEGEILWSSPCNKTYPLICYQDVENGSSSIMRYYNTNIRGSINVRIRDSVENIPIEVCEIYLNEPSVIGALFLTQPTNQTTCMIEVLETISLPSTLSIYEFVDPSFQTTVLYKNLSYEDRTQVVIDVRENIHINDLSVPCYIPNSGTSDSDSYIMNDTFSNENTTVLVSPTEFTTEYPTESTAMCPCNTVASYNLSDEDIQSKVDEIKGELKLDTKKLSSHKRIKISASDRRTSSARIGNVAVAVLLSICVTIVLIDISNLINKRKRN